MLPTNRLLIRMTGRFIRLKLICLFSFVLPVLLLGQGADYYWVGGTGNWTDSLHWSSENGGIPSSNDNVIFDANSFTAKNQVVTIDSTALCFKMDWSSVTDEPIFSGNSDLHIYSSLILSDEVEVNFSGNIYFDGDGFEQDIICADNVLNSNIYFDGSGIWSVSGTLDCGLKSIYLNNGSLNTLGNLVSCGSFYSTTNNSKALKLDESIVRIQGCNGKWQVNDNLYFIKGASVIEFMKNEFSSINVFDGGNLSYCSVVFRDNGLILGNNSIEKLYFYANCNYKIQGGSTQTINTGLYARGCSGIIDISGQGSVATIAHHNDDINISFVTLNSIKAESNSGYDFFATHSIDRGNNAGCNISADSREMFWVNNTGLWSDTTHWTSDPFGVDADCIPILYDNVRFSNASFDGSDTVIVDIDDIQCNSMKWMGTQDPVFFNSNPNAALIIHGSLEFTTYMKNQFYGIIVFKDSIGGQTIKTANKTFLNSIYFNGKDGSWTLEDSLKTNGSIIYDKGTFNTNDNFISCKTFHSDSDSSRTINLGSSYIQIESNAPYPGWSVNNNNLDFNAGNSTIDFKVNSATMYNYGGDTVRFNDVIFSGVKGYARHYTYSDIYGVFRKVTYHSNASIMGNNSFDTISFTPGNYYELAAGSKQTIYNEIFPSGMCDGPVLLQSKTNGSPATISKPNDTLRLAYTALRDITATGGAAFKAENSIDLGNNLGWDTIAVSAPGKLYWVNDAGDWDDPMHWDTISGGPGGHCIPTPFDIVYFDQNSFTTGGQKVQVSHNNAFVHDMDWSTANYFPEFSGNNTSSYLRIYGSLKLNPEMDFTYPGYIYFGSIDSTETIETSGVKLDNVNNNVCFDGIGGKWSLVDSLDISLSVDNKNAFYFYNGSLNTEGHDMVGYTFQSTVSNSRWLDLHNSNIHLFSTWYVYGTNLSIEENNSQILLETGNFIQKYGTKTLYHNIDFLSDSLSQYLLTENADSVVFNNLNFNTAGELYGTNGSAFAHRVTFEGNGKVNNVFDESINVYSIDSLIFNAQGALYGNDTVSLLQFGSDGLLEGFGQYKDVHFDGNGTIYGNNTFDTLSFSPGYTIILESNSLQTIVDSLNIVGNNCESIYLESDGGLQATILKDSGSVYGDFIEMTNILATGGAVFDAGKFSHNINNSNDGWAFYESPLNYSLGEDQEIQEGESLLLCAENFNGNSNTTYEWKNCNTGEVVGTDSCYLVTDQGDYCLTVYYNEGPGCSKSDEIYIGCFIKVATDSSHVTCNGFNDGWIDITVEVGTDPINYSWYKDGTLYAQTEDIFELAAGEYTFLFEDTLACKANNTIIISEPDILGLDYIATDVCFGEENGTINLSVIGGTEPYQFTWSNDSTGPQLNGIEPGYYFVSVTDDHNCPAIDETIEIGELPTIDFDLEGNDLICFQDYSGSINIQNLVGGTGNYNDFIWTKDGQPFNSASQHLTQIQAGVYNLKIVDNYGCNATREISIFEPEELILELEAINGNISLGAINLDVMGGVLPYEYYWSTEETTQNIDPLGGGTYTVEVTDGNGCKSTGSIFVDVHYRVYAPTAFSPNGDGVNDEFEIFGLGTDLKGFELFIYDRWGNEVFASEDKEYKWNGSIYNTGEVLPLEVYTWMVKISYSTGESIIDKGNVTLLK